VLLLLVEDKFYYSIFICYSKGICRLNPGSSSEFLNWYVPNRSLGSKLPRSWQVIFLGCPLKSSSTPEKFCSDLAAVFPADSSTTSRQSRPFSFFGNDCHHSLSRYRANNVGTGKRQWQDVRQEINMTSREVCDGGNVYFIKLRRYINF